MRRVLFCLLITLVYPLLALPIQADSQANAESLITIRQLVVQSSINPITATFIVEQIEEANRIGELAVLIQLDTPGGLDTAMRQIIQAELKSERPVIVYVAPSGARAASAGALITMAADFAVMAPGTNIGAAHPVSLGIGGQQSKTMEDKLVNDAVAYIKSLAETRGRNIEWAEAAVRNSVSITAQEAVDLGVIDLVVESSEALLIRLDGESYQRNGEPIIFQSDGATLNRVEMNWRQQILDTISNPNVAYMLLMLGMLGIFFEVSQPGGILPGVAGAISLLLAFFALQTLPINYVGILLILLALVLFILEVKVMSYGMLTVGGIVAMAMGSLMLIDSSEPYLQISKAVIAASVLICSGFFLFATWMVVRTQKTRVVSGLEGMIGEVGLVDCVGGGVIKVFVHGEYWSAISSEPVSVGQEVEVVGACDHLRLIIKPIHRPEG